MVPVGFQLYLKKGSGVRHCVRVRSPRRRPGTASSCSPCTRATECRKGKGGPTSLEEAPQPRSCEVKIELWPHINKTIMPIVLIISIFFILLNTTYSLHYTVTYYFHYAYYSYYLHCFNIIQLYCLLVDLMRHLVSTLVRRILFSWDLIRIHLF